jgi:protein TonB
VDFTGTVAATGTALAPASGAGSGAPPSVAAPSGVPTSGARAVALDGESWSCPWPAEAAAAQVDEQTVVIRVVVDQTGRAEAVEILADPGLGFGEAARACALQARFTPARDARGEPLRARSPAIAVRFVR